MKSIFLILTSIFFFEIINRSIYYHYNCDNKLLLAHIQYQFQITNRYYLTRKGLAFYDKVRLGVKYSIY